MSASPAALSQATCGVAAGAAACDGSAPHNDKVRASRDRDRLMERAAND